MSDHQGIDGNDRENEIPNSGKRLSSDNVTDIGKPMHFLCNDLDKSMDRKSARSSYAGSVTVVGVAAVPLQTLTVVDRRPRHCASNRLSFIWDDELQYLASLNLRTCILDHDSCHTTYRFQYSGQNLCGVVRDRNPNVNVSGIIEEVMGLWFNEYPLIDSSYIRKFRVTKYFEDYGHFAEIAVDRNTHVGCGIIRFTRPDVPYVYIYNMVCNYASIYALDTPVYTVGQPGSRCLTGKNPYYPGLCSENEPINPNY
ncbi:scoloptoxin SSD976-like [Bactrocera dorsalis]|uniref:Scoloptoxin SSD976-like n=1 Tax=Bactrocera dorsalis TaxID=27457 RepID=A0ABM3JHI7_BACDO|nr:scoloptoxin SSD976-like [Bactrocera dorsalis]